MSCSVSHYWEEHVERLEDKLAVVVEADPSSEAMVLESQDGLTGVIDARVYFDDDAFVDVYEIVKITDRPHREKWNYQLMVDGAEVERHDFDPDLPKPYTFHVNRPLPGGTYTHEPSEWKSLKDFLEKSWWAISDFRQQMAAPNDEDVESE